MGKGKLIGIILGLFLGLAVTVKPAMAITPKVSITALPEYTTTNSLKLQYSAIADIPGDITAQFYFRKDGNAYASFGGGYTGSNGIIQTTDVQINDQAKYFFKVVLGTGEFAETSVTYDVTAPGEPGGFSKERLGLTTYKIKWHTPNSDDFGTVIIYRGEKSDLDANSGAEVARVGGSKDTDYEWVDNGVEPGKDYYYVIRATDKAGNSSNLVGDSELTAVLGISTTAQVTPAGTKVTSLPKEQAVGGEVLSGSAEPTPTTAMEGVVNQIAETAKAISKSKLGGIIVGVILLGLATFFLFKKRSQ